MGSSQGMIDDPLETMTRYGPLTFPRSFARRKPRAQLTVRARAWQLLLDMISENNKLLHTKNEQPVKIKQRKRQAKPHIYVQSQRLLGKHLFMIMVTTY